MTDDKPITFTFEIEIKPPNMIHHRLTWTGQERNPGGDIGYSTGATEWQMRNLIFAMRKIADDMEGVLNAQIEATKQ